MKRRVFTITVLLATVMFLLTGCNSSDYKKATELLESGSYEEAAELFSSLGDYEDSAELLKTCHYKEAEALLENDQYMDAADIYASLGDYEDCKDKYQECLYEQAGVLVNEGKLEEAADMYDSLNQYKDSKTKLEEINHSIMMEKYADTIALLQGKTWYFNGGSDTALAMVSFSDDKATISSVTFDGNGIHDDVNMTSSYTLDDSHIIIEKAVNNEPARLDYTIDGNTISFEESVYFTKEEVDEAIQGYWKCRYTSNVLGISGDVEYNIHIDNGNLTSESASEAAFGAKGEYFYYGPYQATYTLGDGCFNTSMKHGDNWFFNIIDGRPVILYYDHVCVPADKLPGENGYSF